MGRFRDEQGTLKWRVIKCWSTWPRISEEEISELVSDIKDAISENVSDQSGYSRSHLTSSIVDAGLSLWVNPAASDQGAELIQLALDLGDLWYPPARNHSTGLPEILFAQMAVHENEGWREWAAQDETTPEAILVKLSQDKRAKVKAVACSNRMLPVTALLAALEGEKRVTVRNAIEQRLRVIPSEYGGQL
jgi:hypothetical protein